MCPRICVQPGEIEARCFVHEAAVFRAQRKMSREGIVGAPPPQMKVPLAGEVAPANMPPLALSDEIVRVGVGPPQVLPSTQPLSKKLNGKKLPEQERRAGWHG